MSKGASSKKPWLFFQELAPGDYRDQFVRAKSMKVLVKEGRIADGATVSKRRDSGGEDWIIAQTNGVSLNRVKNTEGGGRRNVRLRFLIKENLKIHFSIKFCI